jgi:hypothetical protein
MNRRRFLAGVAGAGALAGGAWLARSGGTADALEPVTVETLDARGSSSGELTLFDGGVAVVDLFATTCPPCKPQVGNLANAREELDVQFVSVTNQMLGGTLTKGDLRNWWADAGGNWPVALDADGAVTRTLGARNLPYTAVVDGDRVAWAEAGTTDPATVVSAVEEVTG